MSVMEVYRQAKKALDAWKDVRRIWYGDDEPEVAVWVEVSERKARTVNANSLN